MRYSPGRPAEREGEDVDVQTLNAYSIATRTIYVESDTIDGVPGHKFRRVNGTKVVVTFVSEDEIRRTLSPQPISVKLDAERRLPSPA